MQLGDGTWTRAEALVELLGKCRAASIAQVTGCRLCVPNLTSFVLPIRCVERIRRQRPLGWFVLDCLLGVWWLRRLKSIYRLLQLPRWIQREQLVRRRSWRLQSLRGLQLLSTRLKLRVPQSTKP